MASWLTWFWCSRGVFNGLSCVSVGSWDSRMSRVIIWCSWLLPVWCFVQLTLILYYPAWCFYTVQTMMSLPVSVLVLLPIFLTGLCNSCPDLIHFSDIFRAWALCRYLSKFIVIGYSFSYSMFCMMVCNMFIFFCFQMQQQELAQMRQRDANLTALAAIGPRKKRKVNSPGATTTGSEVRTSPPNHMHFWFGL